MLKKYDKIVWKFWKNLRNFEYISLLQVDILRLMVVVDTQNPFKIFEKN